MATYDMAEISGELDFSDPFFVTRTRGERAYPLIREQLEQSPQGQGLVLVFPEAQLIDVSFADETIIRLGQELMAGQFGNVALLLPGLTEDSIKNIEAIISLRRLKLGFLAVEPEGAWKCIGIFPITMMN